MWTRGYGGLGHRRLTEQNLLDLAGVHQFAAAVHHVVAAPGEVEIPIGVESPEITGVQPTCIVDSLGGHAVGVCADHTLAADADPAHHARRAPPPVRPDHLQLHPGRAAD